MSVTIECTASLGTDARFFQPLVETVWKVDFSSCKTSNEASLYCRTSMSASFLTSTLSTFAFSAGTNPSNEYERSIKYLLRLAVRLGYSI